MEISKDLRCLFTGQLVEQDGAYHIEVPSREVELDSIEPENTYRIALLPTESDPTTESAPARPSPPPTAQQPPVKEGDTREVEIDSIGDKGDGIARVDRGYVVIVPDTEVGERVTVRIDETKENVAFAQVVDRHHSPEHN